MKFEWIKLSMLTCSAFILVTCGPQKKEETTPPAKKMEAPAHSPEHQEKKLLTPEEQLKIDEDNVTEPFPG